jgi:transcriptional regulator with XRE-family HTH domain
VTTAENSISLQPGSAAAAPEVAPVARARAARQRRAELSEFLRARRSRIRPEDVGLPPGVRRRTPGLRREEVAQLAGVGITWYTWLEQGRKIHVSTQVLNSVARTLRLDDAEREHLYRLAEARELPPLPEACEVPESVQEVLDALNPLPALLINARYDILAENATYTELFRSWRNPSEARNILWYCFVNPAARAHYQNMDEQLPILVATLRASFARHLGEPAWIEFIRALSAASPEFAEMWGRHDVARPGVTFKTFVHDVVGRLTIRSTSLAVAGMAETRIVVYTAADEATKVKLARLAAVAAEARSA